MGSVEGNLPSRRRSSYRTESNSPYRTQGNPEVRKEHRVTFGRHRGASRFLAGKWAAEHFRHLQALQCYLPVYITRGVSVRAECSVSHGNQEMSRHGDATIEGM